MLGGQLDQHRFQLSCTALYAIDECILLVGDLHFLSNILQESLASYLQQCKDCLVELQQKLKSHQQAQMAAVEGIQRNSHSLVQYILPCLILCCFSELSVHASNLMREDNS